MIYIMFIKSDQSFMLQRFYFNARKAVGSHQRFSYYRRVYDSVSASNSNKFRLYFVRVSLSYKNEKITVPNYFK